MKKLNLPNQLTVLRMIITPIFLLVFLSESIPFGCFIGLGIYVIGCITDFLDGKIARKYNLITDFGKLCDPVADKMLTTAALLALMKAGYCSIYVVFIILTREFAVTSVRLLASSQGIVIPANIWGKIKTVAQMVSTILIMLCMALEQANVMFADIPVKLISDILLWITAIIAVVSGVIYVKDGTKQIKIK